MNNITLIGRTTKDAELTYLPGNGTAVAKLIIAVDRDYTKKDGTKDTDFIPVAIYGKSAEYAAKYVTKGRLISIMGALRIDTPKAEDNTYRTYVRVDCRQLKLLDFKKIENQEPNDTIPTDGFMDIDAVCANVELPFE